MFAAEADPFSKELAVLREPLRGDKHEPDYETWADREARLFFVCLSHGSRPNPAPPML